MKRFENKVVAITGGGSGMGRVSSELFAQEGATVCVVDINGAAAQQTVDNILAAGGKAKAYTLDITDAPAMEAFFKDVVDTFGRIDVYFTIAGISPMGTAVTTSVEDFRKVVALDMESVFLGCKYSIPYMEKQGGGVILNLAGTYGIRPTPNKLGYSAAKAGIQEGDVITKLGDDEITSADGLIIALRSHEVGEKVEITLMRGKEEKKVTVELGSDEELQNQQQDDSSTDTGNGGITDEQLRQYLEELLGQQGQGQGYGQGY